MRKSLPTPLTLPTTSRLMPRLLDVSVFARALINTSDTEKTSWKVSSIGLVIALNLRSLALDLLGPSRLSNTTSSLCRNITKRLCLVKSSCCHTSHLLRHLRKSSKSLRCMATLRQLIAKLFCRANNLSLYLLRLQLLLPCMPMRLSLPSLRRMNSFDLIFICSGRASLA